MRTGLALLLCVLVNACATQPSADALAASAVLKHSDHQVAFWLAERASEEAPERADLQWLRIRTCAAMPDCDPAALETRLREVDAGNAAALLGPISRAMQAQRDEEVDALLASFAAAERFDTYWAALVSRLSKAAVQSGSVPRSEAGMVMVGNLAAILVPPFKGLSDACRGERLERPGVRQSCERITSVLRNGDSGIAEMFGITLTRRLWPEASSQAREAAEALRVYRYRTSMMADLPTADFLRLLGEHRREQDAVRAMIAAAGRDPDPPSHWREEERVAPASSNP